MVFVGICLMVFSWFPAQKYGNNIKYIAIQVNTTLQYQTLGYDEGIPIMERWEDFVNNEVSSTSGGRLLVMCSFYTVTLIVTFQNTWTIAYKMHHSHHHCIN